MTKKVTELKVVKGGKINTKKKFDEAAFYKKYPWVVKGSVKEAKPGSKINNIKVVHGRVCQIKCQETGKLRTINVQDAFQVKYCVEIQKRKSLERAALRRNRRSKSKKKTG